MRKFVKIYLVYLLLFMWLFLLMACNKPTTPKEEVILITPNETQESDAVQNLIDSLTVSTPTPPVITVMPTDTPESEAVQDLKASLTIGGGGGDGYLCLSAPDSSRLPIITGNIFYGHRGYICLWGFPLGENVLVTLTDPDGEVFAQERFLIEEERGAISVAQVLLWTAGLQPGRWEVIAESNGISVSYSLDVILPQYPQYPVLDVVPSVENYVFLGDRWMMDNLNIYEWGDEIQVIGSGFPTNRTLGMGIYFSSDKSLSMNLVHKQAIETDQSGQLYQQLNVTSDDPTGKYCVIIPVTPSYLEYPSNISLSEDGATACFVVENG